MGNFRFGPYVLAHRLATGGMGEVFLAARTGPSGFYRPVVLKLLLPHLAQNREYIQMFESEAAIVARLIHPNIVQVVDIGTIDQRHFIGFEWVEGVGLDRLVARARLSQVAIEESLIVHLAREMLSGLQCAHSAVDVAQKPLGLVHRDISTSNVLLSVHGEVKLSDFGIAKTVNSETLTRPGDVRGKMAYLAPELLRGERATQRSDLYAVGVVLQRLATAHLQPEQTPERIGQLGTFVGTVRPELAHSPLVKVIDGATEPTVQRRFASALEMRKALPAADFEGRRAALKLLIETLCEEDLSGPRGALLSLSGTLASSTELSSGEPQGTASNVVPLPVYTPLDDSLASRATETGAIRSPRWRTLVLVVLTALGAFVLGGIALGGMQWPLRAVVAEPVEATIPVVVGEHQMPDAPEPAPVAVEPQPQTDEGVEAKPPELPVIAVLAPTLVQPDEKRSTGSTTLKSRKPKKAESAPVKVATVRNPAARAEAKPADEPFDTPAHLNVQSEPWAFIEIDGAQIGQTPMLDIVLSKPKSRLRLSRPGFRTKSLEIKATSGQRIPVTERLEPE